MIKKVCTKSLEKYFLKAMLKIKKSFNFYEKEIYKILILLCCLYVHKNFSK